MAFIRRVFATFAVIALLAGTPANAALDPAGHWVLKAERRILSTLSLEPAKKDGSWTGTLSRPATIESFRGSFYKISGPVTVLRVSGVKVGPDKLELRIANDASAGAAFLFELVGPDHAAFQPIGAGVEAWMLTRTATPQKVADGWKPKEMYDADADWPSNPEMIRIFDQDQAARQDVTKIDWAIVAREDEKRRQRTKQLLDTGKLRSGEDFFHAAFIYQHGGKPDDYLMAHTLATISAAKGWRNAAWIAAATLDRYLQNVGQRQIYGTQYQTPPGSGPTQEPYNRMLISDLLRAAMGVPPIAEQEERRKAMEAKPKR